MKHYLILFLLVAVPIAAQELPDAPHKFMDRQNVALFAGVATVRALDVHSTERFLDRGYQEALLPSALASNTAGMSAYSAAATAAHVYSCYWLHKRGHHRLERIASYAHIAYIGALVVNNYRLK